MPSPDSKKLLCVYVECPKCISMVKFSGNDVLCSCILMDKPESALFGLNGPMEVKSPYIRVVAKYREYIDCRMLRDSCFHSGNVCGYRSIRE
jgi:hypothetical protein